MRKSVSTKIAEPIPAEFEGVFVQFGWERANRLFGKRATMRYFTALGADRLRAIRADNVKSSKQAAQVA